jgi:hypothetical protein
VGWRAGRYSAHRVEFWRDQLAQERRRVEASAGPPRPSMVEATIRSLAPVLATPGEPRPVWLTDDEGRRVLARPVQPGQGERVEAQAQTASSTPHLDEVWRQAFPTREQLQADQDVWLEQQIAEREAERQRVEASAPPPITPDEWRLMFPGG